MNISTEVQYDKMVSLPNLFDSLEQYFVTKYDGDSTVNPMHIRNTFLSNLVAKRTGFEAFLSGGKFSYSEKFQALFDLVENIPEFGELKHFFSILRNNIQRKPSSKQKNIPSVHEATSDANLMEIVDHSTTASEPELVAPTRRMHSKPKQQVKFVKSQQTKETINKIVLEKAKSELQQVTRFYSHFSECQNCPLCEDAFKQLDLTWCTKLHGGNPCTSVGLYPHASDTYLTVLHKTKKLVVMKKGIANPLQAVSSADEAAQLCNTNSNPKLHESCNKRKRVFHKEQESTTKPENENQRVYSYAENDHFRRMRNAQYWKLTPQSAISAFNDALAYFIKLNKFVPGYDPPSWGTAASRLLFQYQDVSRAINESRYLMSKKSQKKVNKLMKRRRF